jgi:hypothetical protein
MAAADVAREARPDEQLVASADWLGKIGAAAANMLALSPVNDAPVDGSPEPGGDGNAERITLTRDDTIPRDSDRVAHAQFGAPLVLGVGTAFALRYQASFRRWFAHKRSSAPPTPFRAARGPHRVRTR